jgi:hypothetical protein
MKQANLSSVHERFQLILIPDIIQSRFRDRRKRTTFQRNLDRLKSKRKLTNRSVMTLMDTTRHREEAWSEAP